MVPAASEARGGRRMGLVISAIVGSVLGGAAFAIGAVAAAVARGRWRR